MRVGIDLISVDRIKEAYGIWGERFLKRLYSSEELLEAKKRKGQRFYQYLAGRFAVKEAIIKTLDNPIAFKEIVVLNNAVGKPKVVAPKGCFDVSISHTDEFAVAVCLRVQ